MSDSHNPQDVIDWLHATHGAMVSKIARREHNGVRTVEPEDVEQTVLQALFEYAKGTDFRNWDTNGIADLAIKEARKYVNRERIDYMHFSCNYIYTPAMVTTYLREAVWAELENVPDIDGRVDVKREYDALPLRQRRLLFRKFGLGEQFPASETADRLAIGRAVDKITERLNISATLRRLEMSDAE